MRNFFLSLFFISTVAVSQEKKDYSQEVNAIKERLEKTWDKNRSSILFTGSSSIRKWHDLQERFPHVQILNTGFGGSEAYDLLGFIDELVLDYSPRKIFIYEGDNDIASGKKWKDVMYTFEDIVSKIREKQPYTEVYLISAKPSIDRWKLRRKFRKLNKALKLYAMQVPYVTFVDVWHPMLNGRKLNRGLFGINDGLHMNTTGYDIWEKELKPHVK